MVKLAFNITDDADSSNVAKELCILKNKQADKSPSIKPIDNKYCLVCNVHDNVDKHFIYCIKCNRRFHTFCINYITGKSYNNNNDITGKSYNNNDKEGFVCDYCTSPFYSNFSDCPELLNNNSLIINKKHSIPEEKNTNTSSVKKQKVIQCRSLHCNDCKNDVFIICDNCYYSLHISCLENFENFSQKSLSYLWFCPDCIKLKLPTPLSDSNWKHGNVATNNPLLPSETSNIEITNSNNMDEKNTKTIDNMSTMYGHSRLQSLFDFATLKVLIVFLSPLYNHVDLAYNFTLNPPEDAFGFRIFKYNNDSFFSRLIPIPEDRNINFNEFSSKFLQSNEVFSLKFLQLNDNSLTQTGKTVYVQFRPWNDELNHLRDLKIPEEYQKRLLIMQDHRIPHQIWSEIVSTSTYSQNSSKYQIANIIKIK